MSVRIYAYTHLYMCVCVYTYLSKFSTFPKSEKENAKVVLHLLCGVDVVCYPKVVYVL
jgi:hypothetical protein